MDRDGLWIIAERGGAPWAPSLLEEGRPFAVSRISKPDRQNSAIHSFLVVDRDLDFMITGCAMRNVKRRVERLKDQSIAVIDPFF